MDSIDLTSYRPVGPELTLAGVFAILRQRRRVILWSIAALLLLTLAYCLIATPHYHSTTVIEVQPTSTDLLNLENMLSTTPGEMGDALNANLDIQTQVEVLQSDTLALRVISDLNLEKNKDFVWHPNSGIGWLSFLFPKGPQDPSGAALSDSPQRREHMVRVFHNHLKVKPVAGTRLIEIRYSSSDPKLAAAVVNDLTGSLLDYGFERRNSATNRTSEWLGRQISDLRSQAQQQQARVVALRRDTGIYEIGETAEGRDQVYSSTLDQLQQATTALVAATSSRILKGALYDQVRSGNAELISGLAGSGLGASSTALQSSMSLLDSLRTQQATIKAQLAQDMSKFGSSYPKIADERDNLQSLNQSISEEITRIGQRAKSDYETAVETERNLQEVYAARKGQAEKLNDRAIEYGIAKQEADSSRQLYDDLSKRLREAGIIEGLRSSNISIVTPGAVPPDPASPLPALYLLGAAFIGLFLGCCVAFLVDTLDPRIRSFGDIEAMLGVALVAVLPSFRSSSWFRSIPGMRRLGRSQQGDRIIVEEQPTSPFAEEMQRLRMVLNSSEGRPSSPKVLLVTSAIPGEGKTTVALNLAVSIAKTGKRVLFVEADMRSRESPLLLQTESSGPGLSELLSAPGRNSDELKPSEASRVTIIPSGPIAQHPSELLSTEEMKRLLAKWEDKFDIVIFDSPSLLNVSDGLVLSRLANMTLLVARSRYTPKQALARAHRMLSSSSNTEIAVVLNAAERKSVEYSQYFGYAGSSY